MMSLPELESPSSQLASTDYLDLLPNELWFDIIKLLRRDCSALLKVSQTCKHLRRLTLPVLLYHVSLDLIDYPNHASSLLAMLRNGNDSGRFVRRLRLHVSAINAPADLTPLLGTISVEDMVVYSSTLSGPLFESIITIPTLRRLTIQNSTSFPKDPIRLAQAEKPVRAPLIYLEVSGQEIRTTQYIPGVVSHLDLSTLRDLNLGAAPMTGTVLAQTLEPLIPGSLTSLRIGSIRRESGSPDPHAILRDAIIQQPNLRTLCLHPKVHFTVLPQSALPLLEQFEGSTTMAERLVPGRPVTRATITTSTKYPDKICDMQATFKAISGSSRHVRYLELEEMPFDEEWMDEIPILFPQLEEFRVQATTYISKGFIRNVMPKYVGRMRACKRIRFRCRSGGSHFLNLLYLPDAAGQKWAEQTVLEWEKRNPTLEEVWLGRLSLLKVAAGEWKAYDEFNFRGPDETYNIPLRLPERLP